MLPPDRFVLVGSQRCLKGRVQFGVDIGIKPRAMGSLPCGGSRSASSRTAVGSLLRHGSGEGGRRLDAALGAPSLAEARRVLELKLSLRLAYPQRREGAPGGAEPASRSALADDQAARGRGRGRGAGGAGRKRKAV